MLGLFKVSGARKTGRRVGTYIQTPIACMLGSVEPQWLVAKTQQ